MDKKTFNRELLAFLQSSPTPFHAVESIAARLQEAGFQRLQESDSWSLTAGKYFVVRNASSIIAFTLAQDKPIENGLRMVGAHTDSPCLKVKPNPEMNSEGYFQLAVETYGGVLLNPWFDRDLSLAGRVSYKESSGALKSSLVNFKTPIATIPSLAIHLDKEANDKRSVNKQKHMPPVLMRAGDKQDFRAMVLNQMQSEDPAVDVERVLDYELCFYDTQAPAIIGFNDDFIASARLDNLLSCYIGLQALLVAEDNCLLVCNDHEEVGSNSAAGAQGPMLKSVLQRIAGEQEDYIRMIDSSMMVSVDNAHGVHPNYADRHDSNHGPVLNNGPVIKINANQRYASNSETSALFRHACELAGVEAQSFVVRSDMGCGSTIGPITASELGVKTIDVGVPQFAMHSIRELAGSDDAYALFKVLQAFNALTSVSVD